LSAITLIFPNQLFKQNPALLKTRKVYLVEEFLFFNQCNFHKQKLVLHRASMKAYADFLTEKGYNVVYINATDKLNDVQKLLKHLHAEKITELHYCTLVDNWLEKRIAEGTGKYKFKNEVYPSPGFLNSKAEGDDFFNGKKKYFQTDFYIHQRKKRSILLEADGGPIGGKWSFDADNRSKYPTGEKPPKVKATDENSYVKEAKIYTEKFFGKNYGSAENFIYPTNFKDAETWLQHFLKERFADFGVYEDAIVAEENFLNHAVISPALNIGLLTPQQVVDITLNFAAKNNIPLNSTEGFIRQIIGWREFIKIVYEREGIKQRTMNYWGFDRKIPSSFWEGNTGIEPIDNCIKKCLQTGYNHHIERLMLLGNFMLLCEFNPNEVYKWFMEMYIDSYDWVMVPNVYGMVQFADGGLMTTKPYISGSNYVLKMSNYKKGSWADIWDALFWRFMHVHRSFFLKNPRLGMLVKTFDKMNEDKRAKLLQTAEKYLASLK
jgi:deoxyribodipyrimidine photolyase-related protein